MTTAMFVSKLTIPFPIKQGVLQTKPYVIEFRIIQHNLMGICNDFTRWLIHMICMILFIHLSMICCHTMLGLVVGLKYVFPFCFFLIVEQIHTNWPPRKITKSCEIRFYLSYVIFMHVRLLKSGWFELPIS